nr:MAG TPA: hypothetical protein [Caudoviricetes sp.]
MSFNSIFISALTIVGAFFMPFWYCRRKRTRP